MVLAMTSRPSRTRVMIVLTALSLSDGAPVRGRGIAAARAAWRKFMTITLPGAKYGLISAAMVVFTYDVSATSASPR